MANVDICIVSFVYLFVLLFSMDFFCSFIIFNHLYIWDYEICLQKLCFLLVVSIGYMQIYIVIFFKFNMKIFVQGEYIQNTGNQ